MAQLSAAGRLKAAFLKFGSRAFLWPVCLAVSAVDVAGLEPYSMVEIPASLRVEGNLVGGLSGLSASQDRLFLLSDDRGRQGDPRFFEVTFEIRPEKIVLGHWSVRPLKQVPRQQGRPAPLDPEGFARLPKGDVLISSEADTNLKPRAQNRVMLFGPNGVWKNDLILPQEIQPELVGRQFRGTANNFGPEGLSLTPSSDFLWMALERPLVQEPQERLIRLDRFQVSERFPRDLTRGYKVDPPAIGRGEIFRGVSSVLALSATKLLVLERSARIEGGGIGYGGAIYRADCENDPCRKSKIFDLMTGLKKLRNGKNIPNFEGLSWGPSLMEGRRTVLLVSDNNFSEKTGSEIIAFLVKDAP